MNATSKVKADSPLEALRVPFEPRHISKLPKETRAQIDARKATDGRKVMVFNCAVCGGHHHKDAVHLDYVGHAALTDRLLDTDIYWSWEPAGFTPEGLPAYDLNGGLWIKLTVCGVTRYGYGAADGKTGGDAVKEIIGDALRNAAMRFGAALDLWHKGVLHETHDPETGEIIGGVSTKVPGIHKIKGRLRQLMIDGDKAETLEAFDGLLAEYQPELDTIRDANHEFWTGDGGDSAGYKAWIDFRRDELTPREESLAYQLLVSHLAECNTPASLQNLIVQHGDVADALDDEEGRRFQAAFDAREAELHAETADG